MPEARRDSGKIYQVKMALEGIEPPIWRRFQIGSDVYLDELHQALQKVVGWENSHLYDFIIKGQQYGEPFVEMETHDATETRLSHVVRTARSAVHI